MTQFSPMTIYLNTECVCNKLQSSWKNLTYKFEITTKTGPNKTILMTQKLDLWVWWNGRVNKYKVTADSLFGLFCGGIKTMCVTKRHFSYTQKSLTTCSHKTMKRPLLMLLTWKWFSVFDCLESPLLQDI